MLAAASGLLFWFSDRAKAWDAAVGAAFALLGAAAIRAVDLVERDSRERERRVADQYRDLDETRRLAYMALLGHMTENLELSATLVNALVHHQGVDGLEAMANVPQVVRDGDGDNPSAIWLRMQIDRISAELGQ
jgi:hypothetical protein